MLDLPGRCVGYARDLGRKGPTLTAQRRALRRNGCHKDNIWFDLATGQRKELEKALIDARRGDTFIVASLECLGGLRAWRKLSAIVTGLQEHNINLCVLDIHVDTRSSLVSCGHGNPKVHSVPAELSAFGPFRPCAVLGRGVVWAG